MSLQTDSLLSLFDLLDADKQEEFLKRKFLLYSDSKLQDFKEAIQTIIERRRLDYFCNLIKTLGFVEEFHEIGLTLIILSRRIDGIYVRFDNILIEMHWWSRNDLPQIFCFGKSRTMKEFFESHVKEILHSMEEYERVNGRIK